MHLGEVYAVGKVMGIAHLFANRFPQGMVGLVDGTPIGMVFDTGEGFDGIHENGIKAPREAFPNPTGHATQPPEMVCVDENNF